MVIVPARYKIMDTIFRMIRNLATPLGPQTPNPASVRSTPFETPGPEIADVPALRHRKSKI
jgi:hypothetical protein